jgi:hypothetical protein
MFCYNDMFGSSGGFNMNTFDRYTGSQGGAMGGGVDMGGGECFIFSVSSNLLFFHLSSSASSGFPNLRLSTEVSI